MKGAPRLALQQVGAALEINRELVALDPGNHEWKNALTVTYLELGEGHGDTGNWDKAAHLFGEAQNMARGSTEQTQMAQWEMINARIQGMKAQSLLESGLAEQALAQASLAVERLEALSKDTRADSILLTKNLMRMGRAHLQLGQPQKAEAFWRMALGARGSRENIYLQAQRALAYLYLDRPDEARPLIEGLQKLGFGHVPFWRQVHHLTDEYRDPQ